ncbi:MAG: phage tail tape measure protein [Candidatus Omnitrophica bacterium]|nr:phage tail tape measure protein [Candidatus Omnitrophota bacterium]
MALVDLLVTVRANVGRATAGLMAIDNLTKKVENAMVRNIRSIQRAINGLVSSIIKLGAILTIVATLVLAKAASSFAKFEQAIVNAASVTGKLGEEFVVVKNHLSELAQELGRTTVFSAREAAEAMYDLASAGVDVANMTKSDMIPILNLAAATQAELKFSTETLTATIAQFGLTIQDTERVADVLTGTITSTKATIEKMSIAMAYVGPIAHGVGLSIEETAAALGILYNAGLPASMAGTALRGALLRLLNPTGGAKDALTALGLTVDDVNPTLHNFADIVQLLGERQMTTAQSAKIFGVRAASGMIALTENSDKLSSLTDQLYEVQGLTDAIAKEQLNTLKGAWILLTSALEGFMIAIGAATAGGLKAFTMELRNLTLTIQDKVVAAVGNLMIFLDQLGPTWEAMKSSVSSVIGIIGDLAEIFGLAGAEGASKLADAINWVATAIANLLRWIDEHPAITKFVAFIAIAVGIFANLAPVVMAVASAISWFIGVVQLVVYAATSLSSIISVLTVAFPALGAVIGFLTGPIGWIVIAIAALGAAWATNLFGIRDKTKVVFNWLVDFVYSVFNLLGAVFTRYINYNISVFNLLVPALQKLGMDIEKIQTLTYNNIERQVKETAEVVADETEEMGNSVIDTCHNMGDALDVSGDQFTDYASTINEAFSDVEQGASSLAGLSHLDQRFLEEGGFISGSGEYIGKGHPDWEALNEKEMGGSGAVPNIFTNLDNGLRDSDLTVNQDLNKTGIQTLQTIKETQIIQEAQDVKLQSLRYLSELPGISTKLDDLEIEINNYVTNNYSSGGSGRSSSGGSSGTSGAKAIPSQESSHPGTSIITTAKISDALNKSLGNNYKVTF